MALNAPFLPVCVLNNKRIILSRKTPINVAIEGKLCYIIFRHMTEMKEGCLYGKTEKMQESLR